MARADGGVHGRYGRRVPGLIYLDNHATTLIDPRVVEDMLPWLYVPTNAGSAHSLGRQARVAVELAREQVAALISAHPREIIFTSGATEANNLAIKGWCQSEGRMATSAYEHKSVLVPLQGDGKVLLRPGGDGLINPEDVDSLPLDVKHLSVMWANNEVGTINDIEAIGARCVARGIVLHSDAAQAVGKIPVNVESTDVGTLSMSAHKLHGPQGVGALYVSKSRPRVLLEPLLDGGGQERGMRSGTLNVAGIVGFGRACAIAAEELDRQGPVGQLRDRLLEGLLELGGVVVNGSMNRLPGNLNVSISGVYGPDLVRELADKVALSNGSACNSGLVKPSYVLTNMGIHPARANEAVRFGLSKFTTKNEIEDALGHIAKAVRGLRDARRA